LLLAKDVPAAELGRANKEAAWTVLGRALMHQGKYEEAKTELLKVLNSGSGLTLVPNYFDNFTEEGEFNKESIWEIGYATLGDNNWDATGRDGGAVNERSVRSQEYSAVGWRNLIPSAGLVNEYERPFLGDAKEDPRLHENFYFIGDKFANGTKTLTNDLVPGLLTPYNGGQEKISWRKYSVMYKQDPGGYLNTGINLRIIRLAEVILNLAECEAELNNLGPAVDYLNQIRTRTSVNMPTYPTPRFPVGTQAEVRRAVQHERRVELAGEQIRNRDILRWRKLGKLTTEPISYFDAAKHALLPIPQNEIDTNDKIEQADQNPGY
jgi:starch-binding outer membrane protein, SusD/RagB family